MTPRADDGSALQPCYLAVLALLASTLLLDAFWGHVLREVLLFAIACVLLWEVVSMRASLKSTYELLDNLLGNMCDGYVLLRRDGSVCYADPMSTDTLGLRADGDDTAFGSGRGVAMGLRTQRMTVRGHCLELETYTIPCAPRVQGLLAMLAGGLRAPLPLAEKGQQYLCTIRIRQDEGERSPTLSGGPGELPARGAETPAPSTAMGRMGPDRPSLSATHGGQSHIIQPECPADEEGLSDLCSVMAPQGGAPAGQKDTPYQLPGSAWQAIQAVGLGVGSYKRVRMVARGGQGSVWQVTGQDGVRYAQKDIYLKGVLWHVDFPKRLKDADREVRALKGLAWASCVIVPIIDCWIQNDFEHACIVMEWLPTTLNQVLKKHRGAKTVVDTGDVVDWLANLSVGVAAIHSLGFIHRDLKTANILLDEDLQKCKIADLGVSRPLRGNSFTSPGAGEHEETASHISRRSEATKVSMATSVEPQSILSGYTARPGTNAYTSPEALQGRNYDTLSDVFSLGCVLLEVLTLEMPPELDPGVIDTSMPVRARELLGPAQPGDERPEAKLAALCQWMLNHRAGERPSAQMVATHPLLRRQVEKLMEECPRIRSVLAP